MSHKKIIIPFDFSEVSLNALQYASDSCDSNDELLIVHCFSGVSFDPKDTSEDSDDISQAALIKQIKDFICAKQKINELKSNWKVEILLGDPVHAISQYVKNNLIDLAYVGTRDKYDIVDKWLGTISLGLVKLMTIPIYLVPVNSKFNGYDHVLIAADHHLENKSIVHQIQRWNDNHNAFIQFLHVREFVTDLQTKENETIIAELFEKENVDFAFSISSVTSSNIVDSLLKAAKQSKSDLLIVIAENHSFLHSLIFKSVSKELILKSSLPVLFLHQ